MNRIIILFCLAIIFSACGGKQSDTREKAAKAITQQQGQRAQNDSKAPEPAQVNGRRLHLYGKDMFVKTGQEFCLPITVKDFYDILSMQYSMWWNPDVLKLKEIKAFGLPFMSEQNFGMKQANEGILTFLWIDNDLKGRTLADESAIFQLCFDVVGKAGTGSSIRFHDKPTAFESVDVNENLLRLTGHECVIRVE